jgi:hypothetical protein
MSIMCESRHLSVQASCARATELENRQAQLLTSIMCESSRCRVPAAPLLTSNVRKSNRHRVPAGTSPHEYHAREQQVKSASRRLCSRASCARAADVESQQASLLTSITCESDVEGQQEPLLTNIMCESNRCISPVGTTTHEHHERERQM